MVVEGSEQWGEEQVGKAGTAEFYRLGVRAVEPLSFGVLLVGS